MNQIPVYLNKTFFTETLVQKLKMQVEIKDFEIKYEKICGGYCSNIYRVRIQYAAKGINENTEPIIKEVKLFVKELYEFLAQNSREHLMYTTVLPEFHAILREAGIETKLSPNVFATRKTQKEMHVLEDLEDCGYKIVNRLVGYNAKQTQCILEKLAQFHAASIVYKERHPDIVANMQGFYCTSDSKSMAITQKLVEGNISYAVKIVETWPGYEDIAAKMRRNTGMHFQRKFLATLDKGSVNVPAIIHGDLWIRNIFLKNSKQGYDVIMFDYQNCCDNSVALDLISLLLSSVQLEVLKTEREQLLRHYHTALSNTLERLHFKLSCIPTFADILAEIRRIEYYSYYTLIFTCAQVNLSEYLAADMDISAFLDEERMTRNRQDMYSNQRVLDTYKYELKRLNQLGVLD